MEDSPARRPPSPGGLTYAMAASQILGLAVITMTGAWMGHYQGGIAWENSKLQFNVHPLCMVIGMVFLQGDALLVYRVFRNESKRSTKILHGLLHALALVIALVGLVAIFQYHKKQGFPDMYSVHSWCGILAFGFYFIQWLLGLCFFLFPGASFSLRSRYKPQHVFFGAAILILSIATALLGILEVLLFKIKKKWNHFTLVRGRCQHQLSLTRLKKQSDTYSSFAPEGVLANVLGLLLVAFGTVVGYILTREEWQRPPLAEELALSMDFKTLTEEGSPASSR
ncbi:transmembrane ascorbate-dependent reductase CYB561 isoform X1 [Rhineura floridana]|uniref:transmembrane ascorbate-dependent reductase CYB561 isoform X1 n=1 Tax=Rhineura floridana TaxID=261503 RepID=UPI002AC86F16|nr:transmembrane ascorbate-dependent reductase CYB561 isoform X1 [Rhineura floridana]XP_061468653.1 transmembrane ascorbate-dependent reductase CYB561 isoform X1 [Rhineura floridana]XP_061468655.1 transmembrane ascorbate-dependent reductase CYB561 isoform X1 [Rhineura floridana]XP_061468656.1 transmembrane ascorbate-dependent reductase CYB561 isoform X1 [Rhineura floridana]